MKTEMKQWMIETIDMGILDSDDLSFHRVNYEEIAIDHWQSLQVVADG